MRIIRKEPNASGAYPAPQSWNGNKPPEGYAIIPDTLDMTGFYSCNGFAVLSIGQHNGVDTLFDFVPDVEAWEKWKAEHPEPQEPERTTEEQIAELENAMCEMDAINQEEISALQETTSALEDALCEMEAANEERMAAIEDALCEIDAG